MQKSQVDIVSMVLIIGIAITLFGLGWTWFRPALEKMQDEALLEKVGSAFDQHNPVSLPNKIEATAKLGETSTFFLDVSGKWEVDEGEEWIQFTFLSRVSDVASDVGWVSLTPGATCPPTKGIISFERVDPVSVVCQRADKVGEKYNVTYRLWYREVEDVFSGKRYKLDLQVHPASLATSTGKTVKIFKGAEREEENLIVTEVKILLG